MQKWTKGKAKEKAEHDVFLDKAGYERILAAIPRLGKHISTSTVIEKFKIVGSIARALMRECVKNGSLRSVETHSKQTLYTPTAQVLEKVAAAEKEAAVKKDKAPKKKPEKGEKAEKGAEKEK